MNYLQVLNVKFFNFLGIVLLRKFYQTRKVLLRKIMEKSSNIMIVIATSFEKCLIIMKYFPTVVFFFSGDLIKELFPCFECSWGKRTTFLLSV